MDPPRETPDLAGNRLERYGQVRLAETYARLNDQREALRTYLEVRLDAAEAAIVAARNTTENALLVAETEREKAARNLRDGLEREIESGDARLSDHITHQIEQVKQGLAALTAHGGQARDRALALAPIGTQVTTELVPSVDAVAAKATEPEAVASTVLARQAGRPAPAAEQHRAPRAPRPLPVRRNHDASVRGVPSLRAPPVLLERETADEAGIAPLVVVDVCLPHGAPRPHRHCEPIVGRPAFQHWRRLEVEAERHMELAVGRLVRGEEAGDRMRRSCRTAEKTEHRGGHERGTPEGRHRDPNIRPAPAPAVRSSLLPPFSVGCFLKRAERI